MNKTQYAKLFDKAKSFYNKHDKVTLDTPNYKQFKDACVLIVNSEYNEIDPDDKYRWTKLNKLFEVTDPEELIKADW